MCLAAAERSMYARKNGTGSVFFTLAISAGKVTPSYKAEAL